MKIMKYITLFLTCFCLHYHIHGQVLSLLNELEVEGLIYKKVNEYKFVVTISEGNYLYIENDPDLGKTIINLGGKKDTLEYYIGEEYLSGVYKSNLHTKKTDFIIVESFPFNCLGKACHVLQTSIIELKNNKVYKIHHFDSFGGSLKVMKVRDNKLYVYIFEEYMLAQEYFGIDDVTLYVTTFELDEKEGLVYRDTEFNGCYVYLNKGGLLRIDCPFGYEPRSKPIFWSE
ncbi:MAG: hypothetical protein EAZ55_00100 [Cytophagales bacterium]|nr:MAG: hypothetical protein EAZ55_00100 [Cytophagales bacterium]